MASSFPIPSALHLLVKPTGARCNLACRYCFYREKEALYPGSPFRLSDEVLESFFEALTRAQGVSEVHLAWQGGEPLLMGLDFFRRTLARQQKAEQAGRRFFHSIQTNGTLITEAWAAFFREHDFLVGISLDGPREMHDAYRRDKAGGPTFERVRQGLDLLKGYGVRVNALVTVHQGNADHPLEVYRFLRDELGLRFLQFIPIVIRKEDKRREERPGQKSRIGRMDQGPDLSAAVPPSVVPGQFGRFLIAVYEEWVRLDVGETFVNFFDAALANWVGEAPALCLMALTCGQAPVWEHNGDLYPCDHFVDPARRLGNIRERSWIEMATSPKQIRFGQEKSDRLPLYCRKCPVLFACHGGCPKDRFLMTPEGDPGLNYLCADFQAFFRHIAPSLRIMKALLALNRAPAEIRDFYAGGKGFPSAALNPIGRNDNCPCGSGKKFKKCHGR